jgi:arylsulfatase A-like enzyme
VHSEFFPAKRHEGLYEGKKIDLPITYNQTKNGEYRDLNWPEWVKEQRISWHGVDYMYHKTNELQELVTDYCETLLGVDDSIGSVLDYLDAKGSTHDSLVIYMGDNGFSWGEHGLIDKRHFYEESARVPLIMSYPAAIQGGQTNKSLLLNTDIAPTILDYANADIPEYYVGKSAKPTFNQEETYVLRDTIFYEYYWEYDFPMTPTTFGVRDDRYKLIRYQGIWDRNEFYDLKNDPEEMYNLIEVGMHQEKIVIMTESLYDWLEDTNGMTIPLKRTVKHRWGDYRHKGQY